MWHETRKSKQKTTVRIDMHVKDPVVHVGVQWITMWILETPK